MALAPQYYPVICVDDVPAEVIRDLISRNFNDRDFPGNVWVVVKSRDQTEFPKPSPPPEADFQSGFIGASIDEIGSWCKDKFPESSEEDPISGVNFVLLDERSVRDRTCLLVAWEEWEVDPEDEDGDDDEEKEEIAVFKQASEVTDEDAARIRRMRERAAEGDDDDDDENFVEGWKSIRVHFSNAAPVTMGIKYREIGGLEQIPQLFDENGVLKDEQAQ